MAAPLEAFPAVDRAAWEARLAAGSATALADLERWTPEGLVKRGLYTEGRPSGPWGASAPVLGLSWLDEQDPARFRELAAVEFADGARGLELVWHGAEHVAACLRGLPLDGMSLVLPSMGDPLDVFSTLRQEAPGAQVIGPIDPLGTLVRDGDLALSPEECALALTTAVRDAQGTAQRVVLIDTGVHHRMGAHPVQELAYALATLAEYLRSCAAEEIGLEHAGAHLALAFDLGRDVFTEIAKLRAARLLWHKLFRAAGVDAVPAPWVHARTSLRGYARQDPWTNLLRGTTGSWAGVLGGADSLTCLPHDAAQTGGSQLGRRVARNIPLILAAEAHLTRVIDPAAGSHYVECRTDELARAAWELFRDLERGGGMSACLRDGTVRAQVSASRQEWERRIAAGELRVLGVTIHTGEEAPAS
ncbi:MAG: methylmalonyl-CoA mutase family protein [Planctomycetota bacterium]